MSVRARNNDKAAVKNRKAAKLAMAIISSWWLRSTIVPVKAFHYSRAAQRDERHGFPYTAAMEWRNAAELFAEDTLAADYCWGQWERIMHLPHRFAQPIDGSPLVAFALDSSAPQPAQVPSTITA